MIIIKNETKITEIILSIYYQNFVHKIKTNKTITKSNCNHMSAISRVMSLLATKSTSISLLCIRRKMSIHCIGIRLCSAWTQDWCLCYLLAPSAARASATVNLIPPLSAHFHSTSMGFIIDLHRKGVLDVFSSTILHLTS